MAMNPLPAIDKVATTMIFRVLPNLATRRVALLASLLVSLLTTPLLSLAAEQRTFATAPAALEALIGALKANDDAALVALFGEKHKELVISGDAAYDSARRAEVLAWLNTFHVLE
jgi:hypothetical protein